MERRTRISLRRFLVLITYLAVLLFLVIPGKGAEPFTQPLAWVYDYGREISIEPRASLNFAAAVLLLIGTIPPFLRLTWWTVLPAISCGVMYIGIGFAEAIYR